MITEETAARLAVLLEELNIKLDGITAALQSSGPSGPALRHIERKGL